VRWGFTLPGNPISTNKLYRMRSISKISPDGSEYWQKTLVKRDEVVRYQTGAVRIIQSARPSHWAPEGQVRVVYRLFLSHWMDPGNAEKTISDAIQMATGVNDRCFLPMIQSSEIVPPREARVEVEIVDLSPSASPGTGVCAYCQMPSSGS
jgi:hypothetical protein